MGPHLRPQTQDEAPAGRAGEIPADFGDRHRGAGKGDGDAGVQFDAPGRSPGDRQSQKRVVLVLHRDDAVITLGLDRLRRRRNPAQILLRHGREHPHRQLSIPVGR